MFIYAIYNPQKPNEIRYIGKTINLKKRLYTHIYLSKKGLKRPLNLWIKKILDNNILPAIKIIENVNEKNWADREKYWINFYKNEKLLNLTDGGESNYGYIPSEETKKKISESNKGKHNYWKGKNFSEEHKKNISKGGKGKKRSLQTKKNISNSLIGRNFSEEHKKNISESHKGQIPVNRKVVIKLDKETNKIIKKYQSLEEAVIDNNINKGNLVSCCQGKRLTCGGFKWKYYEK